jgi:hypothetical protein
VMAMGCMPKNVTGVSSESSAASASSTSDKPKTICIHGLRPVNRGHATDGFCLVVVRSPMWEHRRDCYTFTARHAPLFDRDVDSLRCGNRPRHRAQDG